jgi:hypothetical protein
MLFPIRKRWCMAVAVMSIVATLGGMLVQAVQRVRIAAERTDDI